MARLNFVNLFFILLSVLPLPVECQTSPPLTIRMGFMFPTNASTWMAYENTAGAITVALDRVVEERILPAGTNFTILYKFEECEEATATGYSFELILDQQVDVLFAPPCIAGAKISGHVGRFHNIPVILWGQTFDSDFADSERYPTVLSAVSNYKDMANVICKMMGLYGWLSYSLIYQFNEDGTCFSFQEDMEAVSQEQEDCTVAYKEPVDSWDEEDIQYTLNMIKMTSRIVILCFDDDVQQRQFALKLNEAKLATDEFVYILPFSDMKRSLGGEETPFWVDQNSVKDGRDDEARTIGLKSLVVTVDGTSDLRDKFTDFSDRVMNKMSQYPFYCADCNRGQGASIYASTLYDATYVYGLALSRVINSSGINPTAYRDGELVSKSSNVQFEGMSGTVTIGEDGVRNSLYYVYQYREDGSLKDYVTIAVNDDGVQDATPLYQDAASTIWATRGGMQPRSTPICGFDGKSCPIDFFQVYLGWIIAAICIGILLVCAGVYGVWYFISLRAKEIERQNRMWQVPTQALTPITGKSKHLESERSLQSSTNSSKYTFDSVKSNKFFQVYVYRQERVIGIQHGTTARLDEQEMAELRNMRLLDHDNVNKFVGITIDGAEFTSVWRYCSRGTMQDILGSRTFTLDGFFIYSLIRDLAEGLAFLHTSFLECHGYLKSTNCLVDDRWQVKISDYGLKELRALEKLQGADQLWTAPEILRNEVAARTRSGDVFSFAVICSEIINMKPPWEPGNYRGPDEVVYLLKKGGRQPVRPTLEPASTDLSPAMLHLIKDCWSENPGERPKMETVKTLLKSMNTGKSANLMDHVFNILESYAGSLEEEVEERTKELVEEKKKSDLLLYRMLPKQVAEKLKLGQSVEPETFERVTLFFSDVVSFTTLASKCTPLQVVNLLNDLYSALDGIIAEFDVYKVETIGDGYLCVSGLPHRNGNEHARHIANMSLAFMRSLGSFSIPHLPGERISLRIGIHTGGCVAGVVGLAMPRFCLFGDAVNTASRMESNGKPNKIQLSFDANQFLTKTVGGYITQSRGEVIIKGKGVMETFWLVGLESDTQAQREFYAQQMNEQPRQQPVPIAEPDEISLESLN